jgi:hypothetical protein
MKVLRRRSSEKEEKVYPDRETGKTKSHPRSLDGCGLWVVWPKGFGLT